MMSNENKRERDTAIADGNDTGSVERPTFKVEPLEPRILLSATWIDADTGDVIADATGGDDIFTGDNQADIADALGGDDTLFGQGGDDILSGGAGIDELHGGNQDDQLFGGAGDDVLYGDNHSDLLDGGAGDDQLFGGNQDDVLISGGGDDFMDGGKHDDTFRFDGAQDGDVITVEGGQGNDTIDLSGYTDDKINDDGSTIVVDMGGGESFTINYSNVENILTDGPGPNSAPDADAGSVTTPEDTSATITLSGSDADAGDSVESYRIDTLPQDGSLSLNGIAVNAGDTITQAQIDNGDLSFDPDADWNGSTSFEFSASDGDDWSAGSATFTINVDAVDDAPTADAGLDQTVTEGDVVSLAGSGSDVEGQSLSYQWVQTGGPSVTLDDASAANPSFTVPEGLGNSTVTFELHVSDGTTTSVDTLNIMINNPTSSAGAAGDPEPDVPASEVPIDDSEPDVPAAPVATSNFVVEAPVFPPSPPVASPSASDVQTQGSDQPAQTDVGVDEDTPWDGSEDLRVLDPFGGDAATDEVGVVEQGASDADEIDAASSDLFEELSQGSGDQLAMTEDIDFELESVESLDGFPETSGARSFDDMFQAVSVGGGQSPTLVGDASYAGALGPIGDSYGRFDSGSPSESPDQESTGRSSAGEEFVDRGLAVAERDRHAGVRADGSDELHGFVQRFDGFLAGLWGLLRGHGGKQSRADDIQDHAGKRNDRSK